VADITSARYRITTDLERLDIDAIHAYLSRSFWAEGIPKATVATSIANSLCFGLFDGDTQVGFARVVTESRDLCVHFATYTVLETTAARGSASGLSKP
jgi:hypothetical protein